MTRREAIFFPFNQLTDLIVGNELEDLDITITLPELINKVKEEGIVNDDDWESFLLIRSRMTKIFKLLEHEFRYYKGVSKYQDRANRTEKAIENSRHWRKYKRANKRNNPGIVI